jgi:hypothetical protein
LYTRIVLIIIPDLGSRYLILTLLSFKPCNDSVIDESLGVRSITFIIPSFCVASLDR